MPLPAITVLLGSSIHLRCSASLPHLGETVPLLKVLFTDRETESKSNDPRPQKSVADHPEPLTRPSRPNNFSSYYKQEERAGVLLGA